MGLRFRKSKKIGAGRITVSKSGIGGSVGGKGFRVTKTARGGINATASIPGTGISYQTKIKKEKKRKSHGFWYWVTIGWIIWAFIGCFYLMKWFCIGMYHLIRLIIKGIIALTKWIIKKIKEHKAHKNAQEK